MYRERIGALLEHLDQEDFPFVEERMNKFVDYTAYVQHMEISLQIMRVSNLDEQEWKDKYSALDDRRRSLHDVAISAVNQLNRLSESCGLEPFYDGPADHEHRHQIGDLCQAICNEYFEIRDVQQHVVSYATHPLTVEDLKENGQEFAHAVDTLTEQTGQGLEA